ncbi:hydrogenase, partial [Candidatus Bathyarchaeota archaeon]
MLYLKLPKENFDALFENLKSFSRIYGPVKTRASSYAFKEVSSAEEMDLSYTRT